jgi:hypothetical protein
MHFANSEGISMRTTWIGVSIAALTAIGGGDVSYSEGINLGKNEYLNSCALCHGATGKGDGPVIRSLIKAPPDLTKLSEANHGVFPFSHVYDVIDGRIQVMTHGTRDMPVWGEVYRRESGFRQNGVAPNFLSKEVAESIVRVRMLALIEYISTLQSK